MIESTKPSPVPSEPGYLQRLVRRLRWELWQCLKGVTLMVLLFIALDVRADLGWVRIFCAAVVLNYLADVLNAQPNPKLSDAVEPRSAGATCSAVSEGGVRE